MLNYAFGDIIEQFEDDYDSEDSEFIELMHRKMKEDKRAGGISSHDEANSRGLSTMPTSLAGGSKVIQPLNDHASIEQALLASWKVKSLTRKKVRLHGKEVHYTFKFNLASKMNEAGRKFTKMRDERLRNLDEEGDKKMSEY